MLLGVPREALVEGLVCHRVGSLTVPAPPQIAACTRDALQAALYSSLFHRILARVNGCLLAAAASAAQTASPAALSPTVVPAVCTPITSPMPCDTQGRVWGLGPVPGLACMSLVDLPSADTGSTPRSLRSLMLTYAFEKLQVCTYT